MKYNPLHASYLKTIFNRELREKSIDIIMSGLKDVDFDSFVITGVSGIAFGAVLADRMGKEITIVRKSDDSSHSWCKVENIHKNMKVIFLDDFIETGTTLINVLMTLKGEGSYFNAENFLGIQTYHISDANKPIFISRNYILEEGVYGNLWGSTPQIIRSLIKN